MDDTLERIVRLRELGKAAGRVAPDHELRLLNELPVPNPVLETASLPAPHREHLRETLSRA